ncbi:hypothetical protein LTR74_016263 [Friedmanniomyces endolithicus]|nr:hypothetical protein LTR74_016263 [Friedmanniomyces endolithicus]
MSAAWCHADHKPDETCSAVAAQYGIQLSTSEADSAAGSDTCRDLLAGYRICLATGSLPATTTAIATTTINDTLTISSPTANSTSVLTSTRSTIVTSSTATLTFTIGTGTSTAIRTITVVHTSTDVVTFTRTIGHSSLIPSSSFVGSLNTTTASTIAASTSATNSTTNSSVSSTSRASSSNSVTSTTSTSSLLSSSKSSTPGSSACTGTAAPPAPTQSGVIAGCTEWYTAVVGDYCSSVAARYGLNVDTFMAWNPAVDAPTCPNMLIGDAYCVATCGGPSSTVSTSSPTSLTTSSSTLTVSSFATSSTATATISSRSSTSSPTTTGSTIDVYKTYTGDGSIADGWPAQSQWTDFESMFTANTANMKASCAQWSVPDDTDAEVADMKTAIQAIASTTGVDARVILAIIMQESTGCVRVITTEYSVFNPGLMQSHNGTGTCNPSTANLVQTPCPASEIHQMIQDGTAGTTSGDGLEQCLEKQGHTDVSRWYRAARMYNGGSIDPSGDLGKGCCAACYASDVANRLVGWVDGVRVCSL